VAGLLAFVFAGGKDPDEPGSAGPGDGTGGRPAYVISDPAELTVYETDD